MEGFLQNVLQVSLLLCKMLEERQVCLNEPDATSLAYQAEGLRRILNNHSPLALKIAFGCLSRKAAINWK